MSHCSRWLPLLLGAGLALFACSDGDGKGKIEPGPRPSSLLDKSPQLLARDALSDMPSAEFVAVRSRVNDAVTKERRQYTRSFALAGGRGSALATDPNIILARRETAIAIGVKLDPDKEVDAALANASLEALLSALQERVAGAMSCEAAGAKADDCAIALLLLEVKRSEASAQPGFDAGAAPDGSTPSADGSAPLADAAPSSDAAVPAADSGRDGGPAPSGPVATIECSPTRDVTGAREVMGAITASETWSGKVLLKGDVTVRAGTLTIAAGTEVFMDVDSSLVIGWNSAEATILAEGTLAAPIRICGRSAEGEKGYWSTITLESNVTSNSVLRNVLIADGAGETGPALDLKADVTIDNVQVRNAQHSGVLALDFKDGSKQLSVDGSGGPAVVLSSTSAITRFPLGGYLRDNVENVARLRFTYMDGTTIVHNIGIPYLQESDVYARTGQLTVEAGVDYRFLPDTTLEVGWNGGSVGLHVNGTAAAPVVFRAATDVTASWTGIHVSPTVTTDSNISYAEVRQGGAATAYALDIDAPLKVDHVTLRGNARSMKVGASGLGAASTALTITGSQSFPLVVVSDGVFGLPTGGTFTGNAIDQISIEGNMLRKGGTIADLGVPYLIPATLYVGGTAAITIAPGTDFLVGAGADIYVGWNGGDVALTANGTVDAPIRFLGLNATVGFWGSLILEPTVRTNSQLSYVQVGHGGQLGTALLELRANVPVTNSRFFDSAGYGISKLTANPNDYMPTNTFETLTSGNIQIK
jgi:hypothetical protein